MDISFQLLLYISKVKYQEDQWYCSLNFSDVIVLKFIAELRRPEGPSSRAPYPYAKEKETVIMASGIARERIRTTATATATATATK